jgi:hypothetical protein
MDRETIVPSQLLPSPPKKDVIPSPQQGSGLEGQGRWVQAAANK